MVKRKQIQIKKVNGYIDFYGHKERIQTLLKRIKESSLPNGLKKALIEYSGKIKHLRLPTQYKSVYLAFMTLREINKSPEDITIEDVEKWYNHVVEKREKGKWGAGTINTRIVFFKKFMRYHFRMKKGRYPKCVDWLEANFRDEKEVKVNELPSQEQVKEIIDLAQGDGTKLFVRNQGLLALWNDCGLRPTEIQGLNVSDLTEENGYLVVSINQSKTQNGIRRLPSYLAMPFIKKYLGLRGIEVKDNRDQPLFTDRFGNRMTSDAIRMVVKRAFKKAKVNLPKSKRIIGKVFRNTFSYRAADHYNYSQLYYALGWSRGISGIYNPKDYRKLIEPYSKMIREENNPMLPKLCKCGHLNPNIEFCEKCGQDLSAITFLNQDNQKEVLRNLIEEKYGEEMIRRLIREEIKTEFKKEN